MKNYRPVWLVIGGASWMTASGSVKHRFSNYSCFNMALDQYGGTLSVEGGEECKNLSQGAADSGGAANAIGAADNGKVNSGCTKDSGEAADVGGAAYGGEAADGGAKEDNAGGEYGDGGAVDS